MIKNLKLAAEFLGFSTKIFDRVLHVSWDKNMDWVPFNPHEKTGRHWLVEMLSKFNFKQIEQYVTMLHTNTKTEEPFSMFKDLLTTPSEICFKCIMEVLKK